MPLCMPGYTYNIPCSVKITPCILQKGTYKCRLSSSHLTLRGKQGLKTSQLLRSTRASVENWWESEENNWLWPLAGKSQFPRRPSVCINGYRLRSQVCTPNSPSGTGTLIYLTAPCGSSAVVSLSPSTIGLFRLYGKQTTSVKNPQISR